MDELLQLTAHIDTKNVLINVANLFLLASFSVKSMLKLRALNIVAGAFFIWWALSFAEPLWMSMGWNILFCSINVWRIWLAILERRPPKLSLEEQRLYQTAFRSLSPQDYRKLLDLGQWENGLPPDLLVSSGQMPSRVWMVASGRIDISRDGQDIRQIKAGDFLGETSFLSQRPIGVDAHIGEPVRCISWGSRELGFFMKKNPQIGSDIQQLLGRCLVRKLEMPAMTTGAV